MENPMAFQQHYMDHQRQAAWINEHDWQFEQSKPENRVRVVVAKGLILLAIRLAPLSDTRQTT